MKKYKANKAIKFLNSKGKWIVKWEYRGKVEDWEKDLERIENHEHGFYGIRYTDTETGKVVCEKIYKENDREA